MITYDKVIPTFSVVRERIVVLMSHELPAGFSFYKQTPPCKSTHPGATGLNTVLPPLGYDGARWNAKNRTLTFRGQLARAFEGKKVLVAVDGSRIAFKAVSPKSQAKMAYSVVGKTTDTTKQPIVLSARFKHLQEHGVPSGSFRATANGDWWIIDIDAPMSEEEQKAVHGFRSVNRAGGEKPQPASTVEKAQPVAVETVEAGSGERSIVLPAVASVLLNRGWMTQIIEEKNCLTVATRDLEVGINLYADGRTEIDALGEKGTILVDLVDLARLAIDLCDILGVTLIEAGAIGGNAAATNPDVAAITQLVDGLGRATLAYAITG
jgi:hypothetical protein